MGEVEEGVQKVGHAVESPARYCIIRESVVRGAFRKHARAYSVTRQTSRPYFGQSNTKLGIIDDGCCQGKLVS
jgi:hypothetical protein